LAVQHPLAEVSFLQRAYQHYRGQWPTLLREEFAGTCAVASTWVGLDEEYRALAVEADGPTARWARRRADIELGERGQDLIILEADVLDIAGPRVDVIAALNFSILIYHDCDSLRNYFRHARRSLRTDGIMVLDVFGGPGAICTGEQSRRVSGDGDKVIKPFTYIWEQRRFDAVTERIDCRIHFAFRGRGRRNSVFRYDWRLWSLPQLVEVAQEAGFAKVQVWADAYDSRRRISDGLYQPVQRMTQRMDWIAYVVAIK
jgi:SAM-dependent methyltransferase